MKGLFSVFALCVLTWFASCKKTDTAVPLPEKGSAEFAIAEMGEDYVDQLFFDFKSNRIVHVSEINSWDLAFEASVDGKGVFMNGGADIKMYNTHETDFSKISEGSYAAPSSTSQDWEHDASCGLPDSTVVGNWTASNNASKNEVFLVHLNATNNANNVKKIRIVSVSSTEYVLEYGDWEDKASKVITIPKDGRFNFVYFSFRKGGMLVQPDPPKDTWDIVFTRYRYIYRELDNFPYVVTGALLNPYKTTAFEDSTSGYEAIVGEKVLTEEYSNHRDVIGFDWKSYSIDEARYTVKREKTFVVKTRNTEYWKMHFLDFYNKQGVKGTPSFKFERLY